MMKLFRWTLRLVSLVLLASAAWYWLHGPTITPGSYLVMDLGGRLSEARPGGLLERVMQRGRTMSALTDTLRKVRYDGRLAGVIVRIDKLDGGWAQAHEIRNALSLVKTRGKRVVAEIELEMEPANKEIYIASVADEVYVAPASAPLLTGLQAHAMFLGGVWPKIDVTMQVEKIREYKSAGDEIGGEAMTPAHREMLDSILDDIHTQLVQTVSAARNLSAAEFEQTLRQGITRPIEFVKAGIANAVRGHIEVRERLGDGTSVTIVSEQDYERVSQSSLGIGDGPVIAVVHASGAVTTGKNPRGGDGIGSRTISKALESAANNSDVSAIVVRINSPGGSPAASDEIWLAMRGAAQKKPVIASLGDVAASGGYYFASAADRIVAAPGTLTGSIGVVFFKPDVAALLTRMGIHTEALRRGDLSGLFDLDKSLSEQELVLVRSQLDDVYRLFLERVAAGRKKTPEEIDRVGGGRVWTGHQAFERGLVDELGTLDDAVQAAANAAGIHDADKVTLSHYPRAEGMAAQLEQIGAGVAMSMLPESAARIVEQLGGSAQLLTLKPGVQAVANGLPVVE